MRSTCWFPYPVDSKGSGNNIGCSITVHEKNTASIHQGNPPSILAREEPGYVPPRHGMTYYLHREKSSYYTPCTITRGHLCCDSRPFSSISRLHFSLLITERAPAPSCTLHSSGCSPQSLKNCYELCGKHMVI